MSTMKLNIKLSGKCGATEVNIDVASPTFGKQYDSIDYLIRLLGSYENIDEVKIIKINYETTETKTIEFDK